MAVVYRARHTDLGRHVALKELGAFRAGDPQFVRRFVQESRLASSLTHPNIVTVYDFFEHDGLPYISMELAERGSLRSYVGNLTLAQIAGVLEGVLAGLAHAAQRGVVHRDIKPENIVVTADRMVKITDFGIGKALDRLSTATTTAGPVGTPAYIAPEQARGGQLGPATDVYAVGVMAHEMLVGRLPAPALRRLIEDPGVSLLAIDPTLDGGLASCVERMLAVDPSRRHADAAHAWADFEEHVIRLLGSRWRRDARLPDTAARPGVPGPSTNQAADHTPSEDAVAAMRDGDAASAAPAGAGETPAGRRRRTWTVAAGVTLIAVAVGLALSLVGRPSSDSGDGLAVKPGPEGCVSWAGGDDACATARGMDGLTAIAISPDGENAYVASYKGSALVAFDRDPDSGSLTPQTGAAGCFARDGAASSCTDLQPLGGAESVAVSPDRRSVYVASSRSSALMTLDRDVDTGALTPRRGPTGCFARDEGACTRARTLNGASEVAVSPDNRNVYVAAYDDDAIATFDRDPHSGALEQKAGRAGCASARGGGSCADAKPLDGPQAVAVSRDGRSVYVAAEGSGALLVFDRDRSGALHLKRGRDACVSENGTDGACAIAPGVDVRGGSDTVAVSPDGKNVYVASRGDTWVAILDRDGHGTLKAKPGVEGCVSRNGNGGRCATANALFNASSVTVSPDGKRVYVTSYEPGGVAVFDRDDRGALRLRPGREGCISYNGSAGRCARAPTLAGTAAVAVSPDGRSVYAASFNEDVVTVFDRR
jgi:DNA-binding beta-propeller fold protein YncE